MPSTHLDTTKFSDFIRVLSIFKDLCNDVDIRTGIIRQKTNDNITVFEVDCTSIIGELTLPISNLKQKLEMFKCFQGQEVDFDNDGDKIIFYDKYSELNFSNPDPDFIDNKFITQEDLNASYNVNDEDLLLTTSVEKMISDRIRVISAVFNTNTIQVLFEGSEACIIGNTQAKDQAAKYIQNITTEKDENLYSNISTIPFTIDHDTEIVFKMYENSNDRSLNIWQTAIGTVNITIINRSHIVR